jgi:fibronectin type 3 domain-containing protein
MEICAVSMSKIHFNSTLTYTKKSLKAGTKYNFAVRAYVTKSGKTTFAPKYKTLAVTTTSASAKPAQVKNLKATPTATTVKLTWSKVSDVKGYYVFSYNAKTKKCTSLGKTTGTSYTVKNRKANTAYSYVVQAYKVSGGKNVYGKVSSVVKVTTLLAAPTVKITSTKGKANLTWTNISGEGGYAIYMATSKNGKYTHLANYKANSTKATKSKLKSGKTYYFKVRAYKKVSGKTVYGAWSAVKSVMVK